MDTLLPEDLKRELGRYSHKEKLNIVLQELIKKTRRIKTELDDWVHLTDCIKICLAVHEEELLWYLTSILNNPHPYYRIHPNHTSFIWISYHRNWFLGHSIHQLKSVLRQVDDIPFEQDIVEVYDND
jgi:hypothetical protein